MELWQEIERHTTKSLGKCWRLIHAGAARSQDEASKHVFAALVDLAESSHLARGMAVLDHHQKLREVATRYFLDLPLGATGVTYGEEYTVREITGEAPWFRSALCVLEGWYRSISRARRGADWREDAGNMAQGDSPSLRDWVDPHDQGWGTRPFDSFGQGEWCCLQSHLLYMMMKVGISFPALARWSRNQDDLHAQLQRILENLLGELPRGLQNRLIGAYSRVKGFNVEAIVAAALSYHGEVFSNPLGAEWDLFFVPSDRGLRDTIAVQVKSGKKVLSANMVRRALKGRLTFAVLALFSETTDENDSLKFMVFGRSELEGLRRRANGTVALSRPPNDRMVTIKLRREMGAVIKEGFERFRSMLKPTTNDVGKRTEAESDGTP